MIPNSVTRSRARRWPLRGALGAGVLVVVAISLAAWTLMGSLPKISGEIRLDNPSLGAPVTIGRDSAGVVTITARSERDVDFALGFVHAQDRLFQMELMRRL